MSDSIDRRYLPDGQPQAEVLEEAVPMSPRLMWWSWMKAYGLFAPALAVPALRDWLGVSIALPWVVFLGAAGYLFAVRWLLRTQARPQPWGLRATVGGFMAGHTALMLVLGSAIWLLGVISLRFTL